MLFSSLRLIPSFNTHQYLSKLLALVNSQTKSDVLVVDDGSSPKLTLNYFNDQNIILHRNEINKGKAQLKASLLMAREKANTRCRIAANQLLYYNRVIEPEEITEKIDSVTNKTVKRIAENILKTPMTIASIGPIKKLESLDKIHNRLN